MKTTLKTLTVAILIALIVSCSAFGQGTALNTTTLTTAITTPNITTINLPTTSMLNAGAANQINTVLYVDRELMRVITVVDSTHAIVSRGVNQTRPFVHAAGAKVYFGSPVGNFYANSPEAAESWGSCFISNEPTLPKIYVTTGDIFDCKRTGAAGTAGQWVKVSNGTMATAGKTINAFCTGTVGSAQTDWANFGACSGATAATARQVVTAPGTLANYYVFSSTGVTGGSGVDVATVVKNGTATAITCTFATGGAATTCSDIVHSVNVVPGDVITFSFLTASGDVAANISHGVSIY